MTLKIHNQSTHNIPYYRVFATNNTHHTNIQIHSHVKIVENISKKTIKTFP